MRIIMAIGLCVFTVQANEDDTSQACTPSLVKLCTDLSFRTREQAALELINTLSDWGPQFDRCCSVVEEKLANYCYHTEFWHVVSATVRQLHAQQYDVFARLCQKKIKQCSCEEKSG